MQRLPARPRPSLSLRPRLALLRDDLAGQGTAEDPGIRGSFDAVAAARAN